MHLGQSLVMPEPVERLPNGDSVDAVIWKWDLLGRAAQRHDVRHCSLELGAHRVARLDCHDHGTGRA
jgi:hypothetical protein